MCHGYLHFGHKNDNYTKAIRHGNLNDSICLLKTRLLIPFFDTEFLIECMMYRIDCFNV